jgi:hypothetical protein
MKRLSLVVLGVVLMGFVGVSPSFSQGQPSPLGIVIQPSEFQAFIQVSRPVCAVGQTIEIQYRANEAPYYAYILDIQGNNVTRLLPNRFEPNNQINDTNWHTLPRHSDLSVGLLAAVWAGVRADHRVHGAHPAA